MRLDSLSVDNVRGIKDIQMDIGQNNFAIVGPNGSGKSAVVDALDFLFTGNISRLQGEATGNIHLRTHGPHIECDDLSQARVQAVLKISEGQTVTLKRDFADRNTWTVDDESLNDNISQLIKSAEEGYHLLTRADILNFIFAKPSARGEEVEKLLQLTSVDPVRLSLNRTAEDLEAQAEHQKSSQEQLSLKLRELFGAEQHGVDRALQRVSDVRQYLGTEAELNLEQEQVDFRADLTSPIATLPESPLRSEILREKLTETKAWYDETREDLIDDLESFFNQVHTLQNDDKRLRELKTGDLIRLGLETLDADDEECPLCLKSWDHSGLLELLKTRKTRLQEAEQIRNDLEQRRKKLLERVNELDGKLEAIHEAFKKDETLDTESLEDIQKATSKLHKSLTRSILAIPEPEGLAKETLDDLVAPGFPDWYRQVQKKAEQLTDYEPLEELWEILRDASRLFNRLREHQDQHNRYRTAADNAQRIADIFAEARRDILDDVYDSVAETASEFYQIVHAPDEEEFDMRLETEDAGLDLRVPFYDRGLHPPHALHSEGHQDTMGLCLFLALHAELSSNEIGFAILDDVISSIDASHRRGIVKLLSKLSKELQLILTTHDDVFLNHLRSEGVITRQNCRRFSGWDINTGPHEIPSMADPWERVHELLREGDVPGAAARLRRTGEWFLRELAGRIGAKVEYKLDHRWSLGDFAYPVLDRFSQLITDAKKASKSWGRDTSEIESLNQKRKSVWNDWWSESSAVNKSVHYREDEWSTFQPEELQKVVEAYKSLYDLLRCSECKSFVRVLPDDHKPGQIVCSCRKTFDWSLEKKK